MSDKLSQKFPDEGQEMDVRWRQETDEKIEQINNTMYVLVVAVVIGFLVGLISVAGLILDQIRFNNSTYRAINSVVDNSVEKIDVPKQYGSP